jgi:hypothetical protein
MPEEATLEKRLAAVESAIREIQRLLAARSPAANWLDRVTGSMKDEPAFTDVVEFGRAIRQADRPPEDGGP